MPVSRRRFLELSGGAAATLGLATGCGPTSTGSAATVGPGSTAKGGPTAGSGKRPTLLILGGTAFLGPAVVESARRRGFEITLFNRGKTNPDMFPELEKLRGDRDGGLEPLEGRSFDAVVDTSGYVPRLVRASAELLAARVKHYVFISSVSVYADFKQQGIAEDYPVAALDDPSSEDARTHYGPLKALCEQAAESAMPERVTNIRPGLIIGPRDGSDRFTYWPVRIARGGQVLAPGDGATDTQYIDVRDLAEFIMHTVEQRIFGVFNAVGPVDLLTMRQVLGLIAETTGSDAQFTWVPADFLKAHKVAPWMGMPLWVPPVGDYAGFAAVSRQKAIDNGLEFRPLKQTITDTLAWFGTLPAERQGKLRAGISAAKEQEVLAAWRAQGKG